MRKETYYCDVCEKEVTIFKRTNFQVIFETETTEGRSCKPNFQDMQLEICNDCFNKALEGNYIFASGAMGYNKYYFKNK